jgi:hypothetical protein
MRASGVEELKTAADLFNHRARWKDYGGAALLIVPERRAAFEAGRRLMNDNRDLTIADYELTDLTLNPDGLSARVVSRVSWYRLPSLSQREETVESEFVWRNGAWLLARQTNGPFHDDLGEPLPPTVDAGM